MKIFGHIEIERWTCQRSGNSYIYIFENVNCEGCVLFGNGECSRLCALTHRVVTW